MENMIIRKHLDLDALMHCEGDVDDAASLRELADQTEAAFLAAYPSADVEVTYSTRTGGGGGLSVTVGDDCREAPLHVVDDVRAVGGRVWESWEWMRLKPFQGVVLTPDEASIYDSGDDIAGSQLHSRLEDRARELFAAGAFQFEVTHPDGFVAWIFDRDAMLACGRGAL